MSSRLHCALVMTSFFFFGTYFCLDLHGTAWFHLREATTLALSSGMHDESTYKHLNRQERSRRRRMYWLLFVTERAYALQQHRPLSLPDTIDLPTMDDLDGWDAELDGFIHLVKLFVPLTRCLSAAGTKHEQAVRPHGWLHYKNSCQMLSRRTCRVQSVKRSI